MPSKSSYALTASRSSPVPGGSACAVPARARRGAHPPPSRKERTAMAEVIKTQDTSLLTGKVAVLGYGSQGHAHALNLADSGIEVEVGLRPDSSSREAAYDAGLPVKDVADAVQGAQVVSMLVPDGPQAALFQDEVLPNLSPGAALLFAHGFS